MAIPRFWRGLARMIAGTPVAAGILLAALPLGGSPQPDFSSAAAGEAAADARARETEAKMTDDERFALLVSLIGAAESVGVPRDPRIPPASPT
jgi:hypothetical protein